MKRERGFGLIECLIALAILVVITAMIGQSLQSVAQAVNESNISKSLLQIQSAQATYLAAYSNGYASMSDLSACPTAGTAPTKTAACLISPGLTSGNAIYNYEITASTPTDAPTCTTAPCGFLVVANPKKPSFGRLAYCVTSLGLLHGEVTHTTLSLSTNAACEALPVIAAGTPSVAPSGGVAAYTTGYLGPITVPSTGAIQAELTGLSAGTYTVSASIGGYGTGPATDSFYGQCVLMSSASNSVLDSGIVASTFANTPSFYSVTGTKFSPSSMANFSVPLNGTATVAASGYFYISCQFYEATTGNAQSNGGGVYWYVINAIPVTGSTVN
jgi:prepilin-type N-terminal cleavage/methylation domain-containing protein